MVQLYKKFELAQSIWLDTCLALAKQESKATNSNQSIKKQVIETVFCCLFVYIFLSQLEQLWPLNLNKLTKFSRIQSLIYEMKIVIPGLHGVCILKEKYRGEYMT